jgi:hypothetical protein
MSSNNKIGIILDDDFSSKNIPPYPYPTFFAYETPLRIYNVSRDVWNF